MQFLYRLGTFTTLQTRLAGRTATGTGTLLTLASLLLFTGCPYEGIPLGRPDPAAFRADLLGEWQIQDPDPDLPQKFEFFALSDAEYLVVMKEADSCATGLARGFLTPVGPALFLNMATFEEGHVAKDDFLLLRIEIAGDELSLRIVSEDIGTFDSSARLRDVLERRLEDPELYDDDSALRMRRVQEPEDAGRTRRN